MIRDLIPLIVRFFVLIAVQVIILNNVQLSGYINPYLYVLFIVLLPVRFPKTAVLALGFIMGFIIDMFTNTAGMHAAATVFAAYVRPAILRFYSPRDGYDVDAVPDIHNLGFQWFLIYASTLVFIHHLALFFIEAFRFSDFLNTIMRVLLSSSITLILVIITQFLFRKSRPHR